MNWQQAVENTVSGLGYELVGCEFASQGLLRVTIDRLPGRVYGAMPALDADEAGGTGLAMVGDQGLADPGAVTVEDCEKVTRQLQYVLEVEGADYARLEVSSPGLDRPLRTLAHYARFDGAEVEITLKVAFQGRKRYRGVLRAGADGEHHEVVFNDGKLDQVLGFTLAEVREARLVPVVNFRGRSGGTPAKSPRPAAPRRRSGRSNAKATQAGPESGGHEE